MGKAALELLYPFLACIMGIMVQWTKSDREGINMALKLYWYSKCSTCRNAKKWLDEHSLDYEAIDIVSEPPSKEAILQMMENSDLEEKKFFNTSGKKYRELNMKDKMPEMSREEKASLLASDGMLIKRPLVTDGQNTTVGFKEDEFIEKWLQK